MRVRKPRTLYILSEEGLNRLQSKRASMSDGRGLTIEELRERIFSARERDMHLMTLKRILSRGEPSYLNTLKILFDVLDLSFGHKDVTSVSDLNHNSGRSAEITSVRDSLRGAFVENKVLEAWHKAEEEGQVCTIHTCPLDGYPVSYRFSRSTNIGLDRATLDRVSRIALIGAWWGKEHLLSEFHRDLQQQGRLTNRITHGSAWEACPESEAPPLDDPLWTPILATPPGVEPTDFVAWGRESRVWLRSPQGLHRTVPSAVYESDLIEIIEIEGKSYRFSRGIRRVA